MIGLRKSHRLLPLVLLVLLLAFGLRIYRLPEQSLWYDEALSLHYAEQPWSEMLSGVSGSDHPPLHSLLLHFWIVIAGQSEFALRYLSLWWGVVSVALLYRLGKQLFDKTTALLAAALLSISPFHLWYSQEARMYSLALALSLGVVLSLLAITTRRNALRPWAAYVLTGALALYAHFYTGFILLFANLAFALWWLTQPRRDRRLLLRWGAAQAAVLALFAPWGRFAARQYAVNATYWHGALNLWQIVRDTALAFATGDRAEPALAPASSLALTALALLGLYSAARQGQVMKRALWPLLWLTAPVGALFVISHQRPKFAPRYLLTALPALLLLASAGGAWLAHLGRKQPRWPAALGLLLLGLFTGPSAAALQAQYSDPSLARPDFRAVAGYVERHAQAGDTVVIIGGHSLPAFDYYFKADLPLHPLPPGLLPTTREPLDYGAVQELARIAAGKKRLWLVLWQYQLADPTEIVLSHLLNACPRLDVTQSFHQAALLLFSVADCDLQASGPSHPFRAEFDGQLRLLGYDLQPIPASPGDTLRLTLYWEAMGRVKTNYSTFAQLIGPDGQVYAQHDHLTGHDAYPTSHWQPEALVRNEHALLISPDAPSGVYTIIVGLYINEGNLPRLPLTYPAGSMNNALILDSIEIKR